MALQHPAEEAKDRVEKGEDVSAILDKRDRSELKYILGEATGAFGVDDDDVYGGPGTVGKDELISLIEYVRKQNEDSKSGKSKGS